MKRKPPYDRKLILDQSEADFRTCLWCGKRFWSFSRGNRMCKVCARKYTVQEDNRIRGKVLPTGRPHKNTAE